MHLHGVGFEHLGFSFCPWFYDVPFFASAMCVFEKTLEYSLAAPFWFETPSRC